MQFKVGDWVQHPSWKSPERIVKANASSSAHYQFEDGSFFDGKDFELSIWTPKEGEWCWFIYKENLDSPENSHWRIPTLGRFGKSKENGVETIEGFCYSVCEPFIGESPTFLKD